MSEHFDVRKDSPAVRQATAAFITVLMEELLPPMRLAARGSGYALAVHGTLSRDIDLVAIPWTQDAQSADKLVEVLKGVIAGVTGRATILGSWSDRPHGRKSITIIHGGHDAEIDLSIMPLIQKDS